MKIVDLVEIIYHLYSSLGVCSYCVCMYPIMHALRDKMPNNG